MPSPETTNLNSFSSREKLGNYEFYSIKKCSEKHGVDPASLPYSIKILLENLLRHEDGVSVKKEDILSLLQWSKRSGKLDQEISFMPARVLMQDFTGVPAVVDLATMRDEIRDKGGDPAKVNPLVPTHLVIDHSVQVDYYGDKDALYKNEKKEYERNMERYSFLKWAQKSFANFKVVPPGMGICHQVNIEFLADVAWNNGKEIYPDTVVGTDSHTTMVNGLGVLGWGVGGIEAEAVMLGQPVSMVVPPVVGFELTGKMPEGINATDLVLTITNMLRKHGVVGKFVEFYGSGLVNLSVTNRTTVANMAPEYGATCGIFPIDNKTLQYLHLTGRSEEQVKLVEEYARAQGMWVEYGSDSQDNKTPIYSEYISLNLADIIPTMAGPKRPQDKVSLREVRTSFLNDFPVHNPGEDKGQAIKDGDIAIAAITSCTNTSNPGVIIGAGLLARKAVWRGLTVPSWVKASFTPGSHVAAQYLRDSGLQKYLDKLGFNLAGYGCATCIGNSGPLKQEIEYCIKKDDLKVAAVISGNRNFEGRVHPLVKANYLASPTLVVAWAIAGTVLKDISIDSLGKDKKGQDVYLKDIWPSNDEIEDIYSRFVTREMAIRKYSTVFEGDSKWSEIEVPKGLNYQWDRNSTYIAKPPFFEHNARYGDVTDAKIIAVFGDSITTDHISPAGDIADHSDAGTYLQQKGVLPIEYNSYGARRGNHEVMMRGTFANIRIKNKVMNGIEGPLTIDPLTGQQSTIYKAATNLARQKIDGIIFAGKEYGTGSSRDWAAKGTKLLGIRAVIAESFERIHRSNLVGMGVLPLKFADKNLTVDDLNLTGKEEVTIKGIPAMLQNETIKAPLLCTVKYEDGKTREFNLITQIDTIVEMAYYKEGGIMQYVLSRL